ncbi:MAG: hypothetical protein KDK70_36975, partial [Myxococcales bacterium]|nr:hypothetical protein [Myxococcales bacterium]
MWLRSGWSTLALGGLLVIPAARTVEASASSRGRSTEEPDPFEADAPEAEGMGADAAAEPIPVPPPISRRRSGRGALAAGGVLLGLGAVGRALIEGFWAGPARLEAGEPFGQWSVPGIALATAFSNVLVLPGLVAVGVGARHRGRWWVQSGHRRPDPARLRRNQRLGWGLLGGGLSLWVVTRAVALPVLRACSTNG